MSISCLPHCTRVLQDIAFEGNWGRDLFYFLQLHMNLPLSEKKKKNLIELNALLIKLKKL